MFTFIKNFREITSLGFLIQCEFDIQPAKALALSKICLWVFGWIWHQYILYCNGSPANHHKTNNCTITSCFDTNKSFVT